MWRTVTQELGHEWDIIKPVLVKNLLLKIVLLLLVWLLYTSDHLIFKPNLILNTVYNPTNTSIGSGLVAMAEWDGIYFLHAIMKDYTNLKMFAFFPGFPAVVEALITVISYLPGGQALINLVPFSLFVLAVGLVLNLACHLASNWLLYQWLRIRGFSKDQSYFAAMMFGLGGNAIFHIAFYSESTYMFVSLLPIYILAKSGNNPASKGFWKFFTFTAFFGMSGFFRSVGLMNGAYVGYPLLLELIFAIFKNKDRKQANLLVLRILIVIVSFLLPVAFLHLKTRRLFCHGPTEHDPVYKAPGFCDTPTGYFYSYIQDVYWNLRLFDYFRNLYHMDMWVFAFITCTVVSIWLYTAYKNAGLSGLISLHIPEYLSNRNLLSPRVVELPDIVAFTIQYVGYYGYAHLGSIERFWSATPAYYLFTVVAQQVLVRTSESRNKQSILSGWKRILPWLIPGSLVVRQFVVPIFYILRIIPI